MTEIIRCPYCSAEISIESEDDLISTGMMCADCHSEFEYVPDFGTIPKRIPRVARILRRSTSSAENSHSSSAPIPSSDYFGIYLLIPMLMMVIAYIVFML